MGIFDTLAEAFGDGVPLEPAEFPAPRGPEAVPPEPVHTDGAVTAHVEYAYNPRQGAMSNGSHHAVLDQPLHAGRLHREAGDALCKPARRFWGLEVGHDLANVDCRRCVEMLARHNVTIRPLRYRTDH